MDPNYIYKIVGKSRKYVHRMKKNLFVINKNWYRSPYERSKKVDACQNGSYEYGSYGANSCFLSGRLRSLWPY